MTMPTTDNQEGISSGWANRDGCIVCGTDFSTHSVEAGNAAAALAMRLNAPLLLVHSMAETFREQLPEAERDSLIPLMRKRLRAEAERLRTLGVGVKTIILDGLPDDGVAEFVRSRGSFLLVVGTTEHAIVDRCLIGNVAELLAQSSPVSTLVVHSAVPFEEWARGDRPLRVLLAADLTPVSEAAIHWVNEARRIGPCDVTVAYVVRSSAVKEGGSYEMKEKIGALLGHENVAIRVVGGALRPHRRILALARDTRADLLVIGTHQRHGLERWRHPSVSRAILRHSPVSVVCVPSPVAASLTFLS